MAAMVPPSPRPSHGVSDDFEYYKSQHEQLELELQEFQASSRELEAELEKDIVASEKRERQLQKKVEDLSYDVDEWKTKYKQSKSEASAAQALLEKEVTSLRGTNRTMQLKLRDIEVANDDFERQARNTSSSLEDLESKYNVSIERAVLLEEEIKNGEQERESLRIETQRLRDELSDLKIEAEIVQGKLRQSESDLPCHQDRHTRGAISGPVLPRSPISEASTSAITPSTTSTPPPLKSDTSTITSTPPLPPLSEISSNPTKSLPKLSSSGILSTPLPTSKRSIEYSSGTTPRPLYKPRRKSRPSIPFSNSSNATHSLARRSERLSLTPASSTLTTTNSHKAPENLPHNASLYQIRGLVGKMKQLEERVHTARSKLPAPKSTCVRGMPEASSGGEWGIPDHKLIGRKWQAGE